MSAVMTPATDTTATVTAQAALTARPMQPFDVLDECHREVVSHLHELHRLVDHLRTAKHHTSLDASDDDARTLADTLVADSGFGPVRQLQSREQAAALIAAVEQLPLEQREAFLLQAEGDLSVQEIAEATGVNFETAKSRLRYARASLRQHLKEFV